MTADQLLDRLYRLLGDDHGDPWLVTIYTDRDGVNAVQIAREMGTLVDIQADAFTGDTLVAALTLACGWARERAGLPA